VRACDDARVCDARLMYPDDDPPTI